MPSRRELLGACGGAIGTALAGCSVLPLDENGGEGDRDYREWFPQTQEPAIDFFTARYADLADVDGVPDHRTSGEWSGLTVERMERFVYSNLVNVVRGEFDAATIREATTESSGVSLEERDPYGDFRRYYHPVTGTELAIEDGLLVVSRSASLTDLIDVYRGDEPGLLDRNDTFERATSEVGSGHTLEGYLELGDLPVDGGDRDGPDRVGVFEDFEAAPETCEITRLVVFATEDVVDESRVRDALDEERHVTVVDSSVDGRTVTVRGTRPTETL